MLGAQQPGAGHIDIVHAYALAELGRHAEAVKAFEDLQPLDGSEAVQAALLRERSVVERALKYTQECAKEKSCEAEDFLAVGKPAEALGWQKQAVRAIRDAQNVHLRKGEELDGGGMTVQTGDERDSTGGRSAQMADALDLRARIEAAMGQTGAALKDLDAAVKALPESTKSAPREAGYDYHRALILAEGRQYAKAAGACGESLRIDGSTAVLGERRALECAAIEALAGGAGTER
jgi:tetratricopeptide (TPR) repeat protein